MKRTQLVMALVALAAAPALAHEHGGHAVGIVREVSAERIVIETADGHRVTFSVTKDTRFTRSGAPARPEDVKPGERAAVHGERHGETLSALRVKLGAERAVPAPHGG